jgi:hypothetical protein
MIISGHRARSIFNRYNIVSDDDLRHAAQRQAEYLASSLGTIPGAICKFPEKKGGLTR